MRHRKTIWQIKMDKLQTVLKMILRDVSADDILDSSVKLSYSDFSADNMRRIANSYLKQYSNNDIANMHNYLVNEMERMYSHITHNNSIRRTSINIFDPIFIFANYELIEENGVPVCRYEELLRWRMMSNQIDRDLFVTAFLAFKDLWNSNDRHDFFWQPDIGHNNTTLNNIMKKGSVDNHFHLKGSAPYFMLNWCSLMNNVCSNSFQRTLHEYTKNRLNVKYQYSDPGENALYMQWLQAAVIRLFLFSKLSGQHLKFENYSISTTDVLKYINTNDIDDNIVITQKDIQNANITEFFDGKITHKNDMTAAVIRFLRQNIFDIEAFYRLVTNEEKSLRTLFIEYFEDDNTVLIDCIKPLIDDETYFTLFDNAAERFVRTIITDKNRLEMNKRRIQACIDIEKNIDLCRYDYAQSLLGKSSGKYVPNQYLAGERCFMYLILKKVCAMSEDIYPYMNLFYAYLVIKENVRAELIQINNVVGFDNFKIYQDRKEDFITDKAMAQAMFTSAIRDTVTNQKILCIEARISPRDTASENAKYIKRVDNTILAGIEDDERHLLMDKYFYVFHFIKGPDDAVPRECGGDFGNIICRHHKKRFTVKKQALAIAKFRESYHEMSKRVLGIDAANDEIACRPEVFAQAFRYLRDHTAFDENGNNLQRLGVTYHVGEDFLDVVDGLRAIDEAILYLNMRSGDRIGHALALGIDVREWYEFKDHRILISQQAYLDNIVWLYMSIIRYRIEHSTDVLEYLEKECNKYINRIYQNQHCAESSYQQYRDKYNNTDAHYNCSIYNYYDAWMLRGDAPECYFDGKFEMPERYMSKWDDYAINMEYPRDTNIRYDRNVAYIYSSYHYNSYVKNEGAKNINVIIPDMIVNIICKVQEAMRMRIAEKGLCIETNPSSNYHIGTLTRYDKHPIRSFYNLELAVNNHEEIRQPQISVCINTDDQGVFDTCLENEFALIALALEKFIDNDGRKKYSSRMVYNWIDKIRENGINVCFKKDINGFN